MRAKWCFILLFIALEHSKSNVMPLFMDELNCIFQTSAESVFGYLSKTLKIVHFIDLTWDNLFPT
jgi:hypothetical protein